MHWAYAPLNVDLRARNTNRRRLGRVRDSGIYLDECIIAHTSLRHCLRSLSLFASFRCRSVSLSVLFIEQTLLYIRLFTFYKPDALKTTTTTTLFIPSMRVISSLRFVRNVFWIDKSKMVYWKNKRLKKSDVQNGSKREWKNNTK